jgi:DNA modification methylase
MKIRYRSPAELVPYSRNARTHSPEQLAKLIASIQEFGFTNPVLVGSDDIVLAGHGRREAAIALQLETIPTIDLSHLTPAQQRAYILADNRIALDAGWDDDILAEELAALRDDGYELSLIGFTDDELAEMLPEVVDEEQAAAQQERENAMPDAEVVPVTRPGEIWRLGDHYIMCGDSRDRTAIAALAHGRGMDLCITSPPYNCGIDYRSHDDEMPREKYLALIHDVAAAMYGALEPGRYIAWNIGVTPKTYPAHHTMQLEAAGFEFYRQIIWEKTGVAYPVFTNSVRAKRARHYTPNYMHELVLLFSKGEIERGDPITIEPKYEHDVWRLSQSMATRDLKTVGPKSGFAQDDKPRHMKKEHPAPFPVELPRAVMHYLTAPGEAVIDPFGGAGSTIIACEQMGRVAFAMEKDPVYVDVGVRRWQTFSGKQAILESSGQTFDELAAERTPQVAAAA